MDESKLPDQESEARHAVLLAFVEQLKKTLDFVLEQEQRDFTSEAVNRETDFLRVKADELMRFYPKASREDILKPIIRKVTSANPEFKAIEPNRISVILNLEK